MSRSRMGETSPSTKWTKASEWLRGLEKSRSGAARAEIAGLCGDAQIGARLRELGFNNGESMEYRGRAPFGGPWLLRLGTVVVALRQNEAECLLVVTASDPRSAPTHRAGSSS